MKTISQSTVAALLAAAVLSACGGGSQAQPLPTAPAASSTSNASSNWNDTVVKAKSEGTVTVAASGPGSLRTEMADPFKKRYPEISPDWSVMSGAQIMPRVLAERAANKVQTDIIVAGNTTGIAAMDGHALADLHPYLAGPDLDPAKELNGQWHFADNAGKYLLVFSAYVKIAWLANKSVDTSQFTSWTDLLNPKWKGKIIMGDPAVAGAGHGDTAYWYENSELGKSFVEQFFKQQQPTLARDDTQMINAVGEGQYLLGVGIGDSNMVDAVNKGLPVQLVSVAKFKETPYVTAGPGVVSVVEGAPHPDAVKTYLNWMLGPEGQSAWAKATGLPSYRTDAPHQGVYEPMVLKTGVKYFESQTEDAARRDDEVIKYVKQLVSA